jgi:hypothetical protein
VFVGGAIGTFAGVAAWSFGGWAVVCWQLLAWSLAALFVVIAASLSGSRRTKVAAQKA